VLEGEPEPADRLARCLQTEDQLSRTIKAVWKDLGVFAASLLFSRSARKAPGRDDLGYVSLSLQP
jgi:hypothetical protein